MGLEPSGRLGAQTVGRHVLIAHPTDAQGLSKAWLQHRLQLFHETGARALEIHQTGQRPQFQGDVPPLCPVQHFHVLLCLHLDLGDGYPMGHKFFYLHFLTSKTRCNLSLHLGP